MLDPKYTQMFSKTTINNLEKYGNCKIVKVSIGKHDIYKKFLRYSILNILTDGFWSKELINRNKNYLKHTYIICTIKDETEQELDIVISKELSFICKIHKDYLKYTNMKIKEEILELTSFNQDINININTLLEQTIKNIGEEQFLIWTPITSCQDFTKNILVTIDAFNYKYALSNKQYNIRLYDEHINKFIMQYIGDLFALMSSKFHVTCDVYVTYMRKLYGLNEDN